MRTRARVAQARAAVERVNYERALFKRQIRLEVERAWLSWREVGARMGSQEDAVRQAQKGLQVTEARYRSGVGTQLEILSAQLALVEARTGLAQSRKERAMSLMLVELAVGRLGEDAAD
jgi:outer membrane protein TolC